MGKARNSLDPNKPQFSQVELCEVAEIPMATANNWILTGALRPADVGSRRARKPRLFSVVTIFEAKVTGDLVKWLGTPPPIAAAMARKTTDGHKWYWSIPRDLASNNPRNFFAIVFWSDQCRDWDASVDVASGDVLRNKMKAIAEARGEPKLPSGLSSCCRSQNISHRSTKSVRRWSTRRRNRGMREMFGQGVADHDRKLYRGRSESHMVCFRP
jgi:hypothetical protein